MPEQSNPPVKKIYCAIYTRKSTDENLDQEFNSLDAQREAGENFINSQKQAGWVALSKHYDDGGFSGATMDRPALKELLNDIQSGHVNCVVVYKVDRLSRSVLDFLKLMDTWNKRGVMFVSVTQEFNTTTPVGRLALNVLLTFAQFEREMIAERTHYKMAAARRKGKWVGGNLVLGYDLAPGGRALVVNEAEANQVREIYHLYRKLGALMPVLQELDARDWRMKTWTTREGRRVGGARFTKTTLYNLLTNVIYTGQVRYGGTLYKGEHPSIVDAGTWNEVQQHLNRNGRRGGRNRANKYGALLKGLIRCDCCGSGMIHTYTPKENTVYRYYVCATAHQRGWNKCVTRSVSAPELEGAVLEQVRGVARRPEVLAEVLHRLESDRQRAGAHTVAITDPAHVQGALNRFDQLWDHLATREQERFIRAFVKEIRYDGSNSNVIVAFQSEALRALCTKGEP